MSPPLQREIGGRERDGREKLRDLVAGVMRYLPAQGAITAFVHHNPLHAFEDRPFAEAVAVAGQLYQCEPYLTEERYREELERGRIREQDLETVLEREAGVGNAEEVVPGHFPTTRFELRLAMLHDPVRLASDPELHWVVAGSDSLHSFRRRCAPTTSERMINDTRQWVMRELRGDHAPDRRARGLATDLIARFGEARVDRWPAAAWKEMTLTLLWRVCSHGVHAVPEAVGETDRKAGGSPGRLRDGLRAAVGADPDRLVHEVLVRFCAAFADQGLAEWELPGREEGFLRAFRQLYAGRGPGRALTARWMRDLPRELLRLERRGLGAEESIEESLELMGVPEAHHEGFVLQTLLALRGWAGMLWQLESRPDRIARPVPPGTVLEFLAVRLILDRLATAHVARETIGYRGLLARLPEALQLHREKVGGAGREEHSKTQRAYLVFLLAQSLGWMPRELFALGRAEWGMLLDEIEAFPSLERRRIFQLAYERRYRVQTLDALRAHAPRHPPDHPPAVQLVCCIDEREESLRRHLEEIAPEIETFGVAGFFGVAMYYRGLWEAHEMPLCPVAIRPQHRVRERAVSGEEARQARGAASMRRLGLAMRQVHAGSRGFWFGLLVALLGSAAALPMVGRVLFPRLSARLRRRAGTVVRRKVRTDLALEAGPAKRSAAAPEDHPAPGSPEVQDGFTVEDMAGIVEALLRSIGLVERFAPLVIVAGHGSASLNNPHEAAHDCGACGGGRGGPNARVFVRMANHPEVRRRLQAAGLAIPAETVFLGAYHNTCDESFEFYDLDLLPEDRRSACRRARRMIDEARQRNAHERCRRFRSLALTASPESALRHVEARGEDLAQPRPEFGHATNAVCVVGRRARTRGLFMDRRAFLVSYDPGSDRGDSELAILTGILGAVVPVCAGINLEYYFSYVDPTGWGCGTKLPHNITSLLGVMDGTSSDLRPGLPWQMVEIHEPVRLLMVVEASPGDLAGILARDQELARFCRHGWIQLASLDPSSPEIHLYNGTAFVRHEPELEDLPHASSSEHWYGGLREHLEYAVIGTEPAEARAHS